MAVLPILKLPHPVLRQRARRVRQINASVLRLAHDMVDTMREANGVGLAANQVGALHRVIVVQLPEEEEEARIYINPVIVHRQGQREVDEACLSFPGYKGLITRSVWVRFRALDHDSKVVKLRAEDLLAQALEHEVDHLNGILYIDHLESHEKLTKLEPDAQTDQPAPGQRTSEPVAVSSRRLAHGPQSPSGGDSDPRETPSFLKVR